MTDFKVANDWGKGANNVASKERLPPGFIRHGVNVDPLPGGRMALRAGYEKVYEGTAVRGVLALGGKLLIADGVNLIEYTVSDESVRSLRSIAGSGVFVGDVLNNTLYFSTENECLEYDGTNVRPWGVPDVTVQPGMSSSGSGGLVEGYYQAAMTLVDAWGREGGTDRPAFIFANANSALSINVAYLPAGYTANIYVGSVSGETLYLQNNVSAVGSYSFTLLRDDTARCSTVLKRAPRPGTRVVSHNSTLAVVSGKVVEFTTPMRPWLVDRVRGFLQYGANVGDVISTGEAFFVNADKCYSLTNVETDGPQQNTVLEFPAVPGTSVLLPDGRATWMTRYGQAITNGANVELLNRDTFAPIDAASGVAGALDTNGNQLVVTALRGAQKPNPLAASDFFDGEILNP